MKYTHILVLHQHNSHSRRPRRASRPDVNVDFEPRGRTCPPTQVMSPNPRPPTPRSPSTGSAVGSQRAAMGACRQPRSFTHGARQPCHSGV